MGPNEGSVLIADTSNADASGEAWLRRKKQEQQQNEQHASAPSSSTFGDGEKFANILAAERFENETMTVAAEVDGVINGNKADSLESGTAARENVGGGSVERGAVILCNAEMSASNAYREAHREAQQRRAAEKKDRNENQLTAGKSMNPAPPTPDFNEPSGPSMRAVG